MIVCANAREAFSLPRRARTSMGYDLFEVDEDQRIATAAQKSNRTGSEGHEGVSLEAKALLPYFCFGYAGLGRLACKAQVMSTYLDSIFKCMIKVSTI